MPKKLASWQKKSDTPGSSAAASGSTSSKPADTTAKKGHNKQEVKGPDIKKEASQRAKEMLRDADAARKVYEDLVQDLTNTSWFVRPEGTLERRNVQNCGNTEAMYWCHKCGYAYCLDCRSHGEACDHHICNYSSELGEQFMPDSIGSKESTFNIDDLVFNAIGQEAYFSFDRKEQSDHRRLAFDEIIAKMRRSKRVGNTYFQSFLKNGIEDYPFAEFIYEPSDDRRVPTLKEHYTDSQDQTSPLLIWRPPVMLDCQCDDLSGR